MEKHLYDYVNEICEVSDKNGRNPSNAIDMFMNNISDADAQHDLYTYDGPKNFNYAALIPYEKQFYSEAPAMKSVMLSHGKELQDLQDAGKRAEAVALAKKFYDEVVSGSAIAEGVDEAE